MVFVPTGPIPATGDESNNETPNRFTSSVTPNTPATILVANDHRKGGIFYNESPGNMYIRYAGDGLTISATNYTHKVPPAQTGGVSYLQLDEPVYDGQIDIMFDVASGVCQCTEIS